MLLSYKYYSFYFSPSVKKDEGNQEVEEKQEDQSDIKDEPVKKTISSDASATTSTPLLESNDSLEKASCPSMQYGSTNVANDSLNTTKSDLNSSVTGTIHRQ